ncbi:MAG TPA: capsid cement protein [Candidatus Binataceae bacterium]|nr:capsid cement protein [Candidatus Binataceae bacterium]
MAINRQLSIQGSIPPQAALEVNSAREQPAAVDIYNHGNADLMRFFSPDPNKGNVLRTYINDGGAIYSNAWMVISGALSDYSIPAPEVLHPTEDTFMVGVWSDVDGPAMVVRPSLGAGEGVVTTMDAAGNYRLAILPDGSMEFSGAVSNQFANSAWDTVLHRVGPGHLQTDGNFSAGGLTDTPHLITLLNNSSAPVAPGTVMVIDITQDAAMIPCQVTGDTKVIGVAGQTITAGATGLVITRGVAQVNVQGPVARGDLLVTSATSGAAQSAAGSVPIAGSVLGKALTANTNQSGQVAVMITL